MVHQSPSFPKTVFLGCLKKEIFICITVTSINELFFFLFVLVPLFLSDFHRSNVGYLQVSCGSFNDFDCRTGFSHWYEL